MNKKIIKITAIIIAIIFLFGLFTQFAYMFAFAKPESDDTVIVRKLKVAELLQQSIEEKNARRLQIICEKGVGSYLNIIFSSDSVADFIDRIVIANELAEYDRNMIKAISEIGENISDGKED